MMSIPERRASEIENAWISGHLYHYTSLDQVIRGFVRPLVTSLASERRITGIFFIRYGAGGPHVRLRLRPAEASRGLVLDRMGAAAQDFLTREPSTRELDSEKIQRSTEESLKNDPNERDATVYADNSFHLHPFRPEIDRYGGPRRIDHSLDVFTLSSVAVLDHLSRLGQVSRSVLLTRAYGLLLRQALGFATDERELVDLLRYGVDWFGQGCPKIVENGDAVARANQSLLVERFFDAVAESRRLLDRESSCEHSPLAFLIDGSRRLSAAIRDADRSTRLRIGASQIHMTASRLGLLNPEEVYLSRLLSVTLDEARVVAREELLQLYGAESDESIRELLPSALASLDRVEPLDGDSRSARDP